MYLPLSLLPCHLAQNPTQYGLAPTKLCLELSTFCQPFSWLITSTTSPITMATWKTPTQSSDSPDVANEQGSSRLDNIVKPTKPTRTEAGEMVYIVVGVGVSEGWAKYITRIAKYRGTMQMVVRVEYLSVESTTSTQSNNQENIVRGVVRERNGEPRRSPSPKARVPIL
ncbi:hypothetical protein PTI98_007322 [Pleurotus ostreatus]|nr:hypothetical protein PTI98_007322 [Pleurotus ostreatus]